MASSSSSAGGSAIQSVMIPRAEKRSLPSPHVVYAILVTLSVRSWTVFKRYSEFAALQEALTASHGAPPSALPPKHMARHTLRAFTSLGGLMPRGEGSIAADEALVEQRRIELERYLRAIVASQEGKWRESDDFRRFLEIPKDVKVGAVLGRPQGKYVPGSYSQDADSPRGRFGPSNGTSAIGTRSEPTSKTPTTRALGAAPAKPIQESDVTRSLNDRQLMQTQDEQMDAQDQQLEGLTAVLRRQKAMGLAINQELAEQTELLDGLDRDVDQTQSKMRRADKQMDRLK